MMKSLYSGVAGLKVHNQRMDVIGNNISNVNTTAFKASTVTFKDIFYQNKSYGSSGDLTAGGTNANQVGYGANLGAIQQMMTQSGLTYSDSPTDCALQGEGFFQVMDDVGNIYYTRNGQFHIDDVGNLCDANGNIVLGVSGDPTGTDASQQRINLYVPPVENQAAYVEKTFRASDGNDYTYNLSVTDYGEQGNLSISIVDISDTEVPFATLNGSNLTVRMDLEQDFTLNAAGTGQVTTSEEAKENFMAALNAAITAGGVQLPAGDLNLQFASMPTPADMQPVAATNKLDYTFEDTSIAKLDQTFLATKAGEFGNGYEINIVTTSTAGAKVKAKWGGNVLTITVPTDSDSSAADINKAILDAAGGNDKKVITIDKAITGAQAKAISDEAEGRGKRIRLRLTGGRDDFFKDFTESVGVLKLTDGRVAAEQTTQDLESIFIDDDGVIYGIHTVHGTIAMGRIDLVTFENPMGLDQVGTSYWKESLASGPAEVKQANEEGTGSVVSGALEMSNTDLAQEISDMIITQRGFQANSRIITVSDTMLEELVNLKR